MTFDDILPFALQHAKAAPTETALFQLRQATIELCRRALVWRTYQTSIPTVTSQTTYAYAPAAGQCVAKLLSAKVNGLPVGVIDPLMGKMSTDSGDSGSFIIGGPDTFEVNPAPTADAVPIVTYSAVCPTLAADTIPDFFARWAEQIGRGAGARLCQLPGEPFYQPALGGKLADQFEDDIGRARVEAMRGFSRSRPRAQPSWF